MECSFCVATTLLNNAQNPFGELFFSKGTVGERAFLCQHHPLWEAESRPSPTGVGEWVARINFFLSFVNVV